MTKNAKRGIGYISTFITIFMTIVIFLVIVIPIGMDLFEINKNEKQYGEALSNYNLQKKGDCIDFCGDKNVWFIPSTIFKQEVCECR